MTVFGSILTAIITGFDSVMDLLLALLAALWNAITGSLLVSIHNLLSMAFAAIPDIARYYDLGWIAEFVEGLYWLFPLQDLFEVITGAYLVVVAVRTVRYLLGLYPGNV